MNLSKLKRIGLFIFLLDVGMLGVHGFLLSFNLLEMMNLASYEDQIVFMYIMILTSSFLLMYFSAKIDTKRKTECNEDNELISAEIEKHSIDEGFISHQHKYVMQSADGNGQTLPFIRISVVVYFLLVIFYSAFSINLAEIEEQAGLAGLLKGIYIYSLAFFTISVAFLVAKMAGNITEDMMRTYVFGYHVHESVLGIVLVLVGLPLIVSASGFYDLQLPFALSFVSAGIFLIGRDWQDIVRGDILVHKDDEKDYDDYVKLAEMKKSLVRCKQDERAD